MRVYQGRTLRSECGDFALFAKLYSAAVLEKSATPFLLVREDDARLLVVTDGGSVMLCLALGSDDCRVSYASSYSEDSRTFLGLSGEGAAKDENFIDPSFAIKAIRAFFDGERLTEHVDFRRGAPDSDIANFPAPFAPIKRVERELVEMRVDICPQMRADMQAVCEYLDEVADDPDENIDFDDAIQIGSLCGGRVNSRRDIYLFSYHLRNGDVWQFRVPRTVLEGIADGSIGALTVTASIPAT